jgi:adenosylhomocysteine nucleosidase
LTRTVVGFVCALKAEARHLGKGVPRNPFITRLADGTLLSLCGMGGVAAAAGAGALIEAGAGALVSWGMAGGLDPSLRCGRIVLPGEVIAPDGAPIATSRGWREQLSAALALRQPLCGGRLFTSPHAIASVAAKAALFRESGAVAVDMESRAVAQVALKHDAPFIAVRVIVDAASDALPAAVSEAADANGQLRLARLLARMLLAPAELPSLLRLARRYGTANRALAAVAMVGRRALLSPDAAGTRAGPS